MYGKISNIKNKSKLIENVVKEKLKREP